MNREARPLGDKRPKNKVAPTLRQQMLAKLTAEFGGVPGMTKRKLLQMAGYSKKVSPTAVYGADGVKTSLALYGLTESLIATALVDDIKNKPRQRYHELSLAADILGMRKKSEVNNDNRTLVLMVSGETAQRYAPLPPKPDSETV